ncbi:pyridoxal phosphate-dependent transferase [Cokeromyces recurvatus]|uniref:pyridoxal phosphate-dependent transferase n=1 Tax=Cokeromyces recurvatus TaxID=90255 RepID=UPI00221F9BE0|nr:pyridoxal phosphate-dependent transferase [Cokeromyces recurvatus]KAI7905985.1 pyridoxal phosphate-dependent transferase [Cokeromyces recurvatus]
MNIKNSLFGRHLRSHFLLDPEYVSLNHGSFGTMPKILMPLLNDLRLKAEVNPDRWLRRDMFPEIEKNKKTLANMIYADPEELVFVFNAMTGINTVVRSLPMKRGDKIIYFSTAYNSVESTIKFLKDSREFKLVRIDLIYPLNDNDILNMLKETIELENSKGDGTIKLCFIDAISSLPGVRFPFESAVKLVREYNILSLVDGAHAIGQIPLNLHDIDPDFFITNCHKWLFAPRGCAVLYVPFRNQRYVHPAIINSAYTDHSDPSDKTASFQQEFAWPGTTDFSNFMCINKAVEFREMLGGEDAIMNYCHNLALEGGKVAAKVFSSAEEAAILENSENNLTVAMVNVKIPLRSNLIHISDIEVINLFIDKLLLEHNCMAPVYKHNNIWYTRLSAQIYNDISDFEVVAKAILQVCKETENLKKE